MNYLRFMFYFRLIFGVVWMALLALVTYASFLGGDTAIVCGYGFLFLTFPFGVLWEFIALPLVPQPLFTSPVAQVAGMIFVDIFTLFFWLILVPMLWNRHRRGRS